jgi:hypothetical protein
MNQKDFSKPLIDKNDQYQIISNLIDKCDKKCNKSSKLDNRGILEITSIIMEITSLFNDLIALPPTKKNAYAFDQDFDDKVNKIMSSEADSANFLIIKLESFCQHVKEKIYSQLNKALSVEQVNKKLIDSDDEDTSDSIRQQADDISDRIKLLKGVLQRIDTLENIMFEATTSPKKGSSYFKKVPSANMRDNASIIFPNNQDNANDHYNNLNKEYRSLNKFLGFFSLICLVGSVGILLVFMWKNYIK